MAIPVLNSVNPVSGQPGTLVTCSGSGFEAGARIGLPMLVDTEVVSATEATATVPADLTGPEGRSMPLNIYVQNPGGETSAVLTFTVVFGRTKQQAYTNIEAVCGEVPGFKRGRTILDGDIQKWIVSVAQEINATMLRRGLSLAPGDWRTASAESAQPDPGSVLEMVNRYGAAANLAGAIAMQLPQSWEFPKVLLGKYDRQLKALANGDYDVLFRPGAPVIETGPSFAGSAGETPVFPVFRMEEEF